MQYPDLIWTGLVGVGGFLLLIGHEKELNKTNWWGVGLLFVGFLFQVYWELATNPTGGDILGINANIFGVTIILIIEELLLIWPGWYRKWLSKRKLQKTKSSVNK
ncbi:MAG: hypothetical protein PHY28_01935 [Dehalococcoidales bacterium]|nr:hypothetical protein [Dehalococcoidales bacterium]